MPKINGHTIADIIKAKGIDIPIIAITAKTKGNIEQTLGAFTAHLEKPIDANQFIHQIETFL
jgi:CheY-like chemotaxis protein